MVLATFVCTLETLRLTFQQTANIRHFVHYKNKIIDREMF